MPRNRIAEAFVEIKTKGIEKARSAMRRFGNDAQRDANKAGGGFGRLLEAGEKFQSILGKIAIPAAIATAVAGIAQKFQEAIRQAREFEAALKRGTEEIRRQNLELGQQVRGVEDLEKALSDATQQYNSNRRALEDQLDQFLDNETALGNKFRSVAQLFSDKPVTRARQLAAIERELVALSGDFAEKRRQVVLLYEQELELRRQALESSNRLRRAALSDNEELASLAEEEARIRDELADRENRRNKGYLRALNERLRIISDERDAIRERNREEAEQARRLAKEKADAEIEERRRIARETAAANAAAIDQLAQRQADAIASVIDSNSQQFARLIDLAFVAIDRLEVIRRNTKQ